MHHMNETFGRRVIRATDPLVIARGPGAENVCVLYLDGALCAPLDGALRHRVQDLLRGGERRIVLDLSRVPAIDAAGVGQLVRLYNLITAAGGQVRITHAAPRVRGLLNRAWLFTLLTGGRE